MGINFDSLSPKEQQELIAKLDANRSKRIASDDIAKDAVAKQTRGLRFLRESKIGLTPEQQSGEIEKLIKKWLEISQRVFIHAQDSKRSTRNLERIKRFLHSKFVPTQETFPREEYLKVQDEANMAQGRGRIASQLSKEQIDAGINIEIENIKSSLNPWIEYFTSPDSNSFPIWAKYWAFMGVTKMSGKSNINPETNDISFPKREKNTINGFPELNREALAKAVEHIIKLVEKGEKLDETLDKKNFSDVYAHYLNKLRGEIDLKELEITEGFWVKYNQGNDPEAIDRLVESLDGKFTNWCTAARPTAASQLAHGDFYVYYSTSPSNPGRPNPRIAIRMEGDRIAEIRGIWGREQNLDRYISGTDILGQKLTEFGSEGEQYKEKSENMKRVTTIYNKLRKDYTYQISDEDRRFLERNPEGLGYDTDPRIQEILSFTELKEKYNINQLDESSINIIIANEGSQELINCAGFIHPKFHLFTAQKLIESGCNDNVIRNIYNNFSGLGKSERIECVNKWININQDFGYLDLSFLTSAEGLDLPESIGGSLDLSRLTSAEGLILPKSIRRNLYLNDLTSAEGLILPESIVGFLSLSSLTSTKGLVLPKSIGGFLYLSNSLPEVERENIMKTYGNSFKISFL